MTADESQAFSYGGYFCAARIMSWRGHSLIGALRFLISEDPAGMKYGAAAAREFIAMADAAGR